MKSADLSRKHLRSTFDPSQGNIPCADCGHEKGGHIDRIDARPGQCDTWVNPDSERAVNAKSFLTERLKNRTPEQKETMRRIMTGEADDDLIRRGDVHQIIRNLRTGPVPSLEFQKGLSEVQKAVMDIQPHSNLGDNSSLDK